MREFAARHPNLTTWLVLAVGMLAVLAWSARDVGLTAFQYFWLAVATVLLAGLCAWIISWEADEEDELDDGVAVAPDETSDTAERAESGAGETVPETGGAVPPAT